MYRTVPTPVPPGVYLGWYDGDKKRAVHVKAAHAIERFNERNGQWPGVLVVSAEDFPAIDEKRYLLPASVELHTRPHVTRNLFFVGERLIDAEVSND